MKDILFTVQQQKKEIIYIISSLVIAILLNVFSIIYYDTSWSELWSQFVWVCVIACGIYGIWVVLRLLAFGIRRLFGK